MGDEADRIIEDGQAHAWTEEGRRTPRTYDETHPVRIAQRIAHRIVKRFGYEVDDDAFDAEANRDTDGEG
jgi:hypothetical protein